MYNRQGSYWNADAEMPMPSLPNGLKKLAIFTEKHLRWSPLSSYFEEHLQTAASENVFIKLRKNKNCL